MYSSVAKSGWFDIFKELEAMNNQLHAFFSRSAKRLAHLKDYMTNQGAAVFKFVHVFDVSPYNYF